MTVLLDTMQKVYDFVKCTSACKYPVCAKQSNYVVDARSILGICSLDLASNIFVECSDRNDETNLRGLMVENKIMHSNRLPENYFMEDTCVCTANCATPCGRKNTPSERVYTAGDLSASCSEYFPRDKK